MKSSLSAIVLISMTNGIAIGQPIAGIPLHFQKHILTSDFISEGVAVGDVNHDGKPDILAGPCWFESPDWKRHDIAPVIKLNPEVDYSHSFLNHSMDVNLDGWADLIVIDFPGTAAKWFENPKNKDGYWKSYTIYENVGNESPAFVDMDGDGRTDLLFADSKDRQMIWLKSPGSATGRWEKFTISGANVPGTDIFSHGLGHGDINRDGQADVITREGWWEGSDPTKPNWKYHPADLGDECSQMYVLDVNRDGNPDVISASAHLSGIWWHEQISNGNVIEWEQHVISYAFAESHSVAMADFNGDGYIDFVTGKRDLHRNTWRKNPGTHGPALLYWFEYTAEAPYWKSHEIDNASGAGLNTEVRDMTEDGLPDIIISNFKGVFLFENLMKKK